jgi:glutathione S-transferase
MLKIFGTSRSRTARTLWAAEELGLRFEHVLVPNTRSEEFLAINPNGHIPAIDDDGFLLFESLAINLYLAEKHGRPPLWPTSPADHGRCYQWSFWAANEIESHIMTVMWNTALLPQERRNRESAVRSQKALLAPLKFLDEHLSKQDFLLCRDFTIADLNVAEMLSVADQYGVELLELSALKTWLARCIERPANQRSRQYK